MWGYRSRNIDHFSPRRQFLSLYCLFLCLNPCNLCNPWLLSLRPNQNLPAVDLSEAGLPAILLAEHQASRNFSCVLGGKKIPTSNPPFSKPWFLKHKALHKYIRIYLYTYISVQKPQKSSLIPVNPEISPLVLNNGNSPFFDQLLVFPLSAKPKFTRRSFLRTCSP